MELPGNHSIVRIGPVAIGCMDPDARDLMDRAQALYGEKVRKAGGRQNVPGFVRWLFRESGLVDDVEAEAVSGYQKNMAERRASSRNIPTRSSGAA